MSTQVMKIHREIETTTCVSFWKRQNYGDSKKKKQKTKWLPGVRRIGEMTKQYREDF